MNNSFLWGEVSAVAVSVFLATGGAAVFGAQASATLSNAVPEGLTVATVAEEVVRRNPELDFYRAEIAAAKAGRRAAGQWSNPEVSAELGSKRVWERGGPAIGDGVAWSVSAMQTFEFPGRIPLRKAIANREIALAELGLAQFQAALAARARSRAQAALAAQEQVAANGEVTQRLRSLLEVLVQRDSAGVTPLLDQRILEASAITLERRAAVAARELQSALLELNQLRGEPAAAPIKLTGRLEVPGDTPSLALLLEVAATNNFDLRMRETELARQGFKIQLARNERYPSVTLGPSYAAEKANDEQRIVGVGVSLPLPLWNRNTGNIEAESARQQQAEASLRATHREVERKITDHLLGLQAQLAEITRWRPEAQAQFREAAELADRHFRLGAVPVTLYTEMQLKYLDALEALLAARQEALDHRQQLEVLIGKPLSNPPAR